MTETCGKKSDFYIKKANVMNKFSLFFNNQASYCFARALKSDPLNSRIIIERASCLEIIGDLKNAIKLIEKVLTF
jgi:hypothetical protein